MDTEEKDLKIEKIEEQTLEKEICRHMQRARYLFLQFSRSMLCGPPEWPAL